ncbi:MAG: fused MFS/spermidine synthase, partial [Clostridia bacterium]|nr:fused MFS/spermidine synthase [Deltaproteobacteria bacterium]
MTRLLARLAFFLSGVAGLTFELVWTRHLGLAIGATSVAIATITAAYMGGIALGSHLGGRIADRLKRPLAAYGLLELAIAMVGIAVPYFALAIPGVDAALFGEVSGFTRALTRFLVAVVVLIVPTTLMGATLPILARAVTERLGTVGREIGTLYAINLAGAVIGAALAGFYFIPTLGRNGTNAIAVGIDVLVGLIALYGGSKGAPSEVKPVDPLMSSTSIRAGSRDIVGLLAVTGASAMALQVLWTRAISTAIGPSTYAFSAIVCAYLSGLAIGGAIASRIADGTKSLRFALACVLLATGLAAMFGIAIVDDLPSVLRTVVLDKDLTIRGLFASEFGLAALCLMPATIAMGAIFPLSITAVIGSKEKLGSAVGIAYAINTVGAIVGSFASVFVLIPTLGIERGMRFAALLYVIAALVLCFRVESFVPKERSRTLAAACGLAVAVILAWHGWDIARWTAGVYRLSMTREYYSKDFKMAEVLFHADGLSSTVTVESEDDVRWIKVDGKVDGSSVGDMPTQILSGLLPMMFHPAPKNVAVIGCGTGVTVGGALQGEPEYVTLIDIEREVVIGAHFFAGENHAPWSDPRLTIVEDDGRNFLRRSKTAFDVIVSEPSNPWMAGAASLFTKEFFTLAAKHIDPDHGLFLQWLLIYELAPER